MHGLRCYGNISRTRNVREYMLVLSLCLVDCRRSSLHVLQKKGMTEGARPIRRLMSGRQYPSLGQVEQ